MPTQISYDTIVAGGGIAGFSAAVASAGLGAKTLLIERYGFLGGLATAGLVNPFMTHCTSTRHPLIGGIYSAIRAKLAEIGGIRENTFDSEAMKFVLQEMAIEAGVELLLHSWVSGVVMDGNSVKGLKITNKSGDRTHQAGCTVDATGDGDVAAFAGAPFETGGPDGVPQAMTMMFDVGGFDQLRALTYVKDHPDQFRFPMLPPDSDIEELARGIISVAGYYDLVADARKRGEYPLPGDLLFYISRPRPGEVVFNTTHVGGVNGTNADDLTRAEIEGRRQAAALMRFVKKHVPGFESSYLLRVASQIGVRETRRITGRYVFSGEDVAEARKFEDAIARLAYPVDVHSGKGEGYTKDEEMAVKPVLPPPGDWYEIPYRCLIPLGVESLLVAGRCVSSTQAGHGAIRIIPCCAATGQAAGTAATLSTRENVSVGNLNTGLLLKTLREQGAIV
ncbi:MAG: FAD-dependent oxidoreductase [Armatimonadota bacterium]